MDNNSNNSGYNQHHREHHDQYHHQYHLSNHHSFVIDSTVVNPGPRFCHVGVIYESAFYVFGGYDGHSRYGDDSNKHDDDYDDDYDDDG